jgi:hypothetical protein
VKCGYCSASAKAAATIELELSTRGRRHVRIGFCSVLCAYWGGVKHTRVGFPTTLTGLRKLYPKSLEVVR